MAESAESTLAPPERSPGAPARSRAAVLAVLFATEFVVVLAASSFIPALPQIQAGLGISAAWGAWILTGSYVAGVMTGPMVGRLIDLYDKRVIWLALLGISVTGMLLAGAAVSAWMLALGHLLYGIGSGLLVTVMQGAISQLLDRKHIAAAFGWQAAVGAIAGMAGLVVAGPIIEALSYHWLYWIPAAAVAVLAVVAFAIMPSLPSMVTAADRRIDWAGIGLISLALLAVMLGLTEGPAWGWGSAPTLALLAGGVVAFALFVRVELRHEQPAIDLRLGGKPMAVAITLIALYHGVNAINDLLVPTMGSAPESTGYGLGLSTTVVGTLMITSTAGFMLGPLAGGLERRWGARAMLLASGCSLVTGSLLLVIATATHSMIAIALSSLCYGASLGLGGPPLSVIVIDRAGPARIGSALALSGTAYAAARALGTQVVAALLASGTIQGTQLPTTTTLAFALALVAVLSVAAVCIGLLIPRRR
ncbi:MFS transporter [Amycolatopsis sp. cg5]|uniref:MFS transporter n=1 Tax=Amycolatopsis sp. cg5 TaxID=3238802 RepID=UPI00352444E7